MWFLGTVLIIELTITDSVSREMGGALTYVVLVYCLDNRAHDHRLCVQGGGSGPLDSYD